MARPSRVRDLISKRGSSLTETAKNYVREQFLENNFGVITSDNTDNQYTRKGIMLEEQAIARVGEVLGLQLAKNEKVFSNDFIVGTPDIFVEEKKLIVDTKVSWSTATFPFFSDVAQKAVTKSGYDYQMQAYMWLTGAEVAYVAYVLLDTPDELLNAFKIKDNPTEIKKHKSEYWTDVIKQYNVSMVKINRDENAIEEMKHFITLAREYCEKELMNELNIFNEETLTW